MLISSKLCFYKINNDKSKHCENKRESLSAEERFKHMKKIENIRELRMQIYQVEDEALRFNLWQHTIEQLNVQQRKARLQILKRYEYFQETVLGMLEFQSHCTKEYIVMLSSPVDTEKKFFTLIFNADRNLLQQKLSRDQIIIRAQHIVFNKMMDAQNVIIDLYSIFCVLKEDLALLFCGVVTEIERRIDKIVAEQQTWFDKRITEDVINRIILEKDIDVAFDLFTNHHYCLKDLLIIKINDKENSDIQKVDILKVFDAIPEIKKNIIIPFTCENINYLNSVVYSRAHQSIINTRNISLDTNGVSYIRTFQEKGLSKLPEHVQASVSTITNILNIGVGFDYMPYVLENLLFTPENYEKAKKTLISLEQKFFPNKTLDEILQYVDSSMSIISDESLRHYFEEEFGNIYCVLLLMCYVNDNYGKKHAEKKIKIFCQILNDKIYYFNYPLVKLAFRFFHNGTECHFFSRVQRGANNIIKSIKNMTWDVFHLLFLCKGITFSNFGVDITIPYLYSFDRDLIDISGLFKMDAFLLNTKNRRFIPHYSNDIKLNKMIHKYVNRENERLRSELYNYENILETISIMEKQLAQLYS